MMGASSPKTEKSSSNFSTATVFKLKFEMQQLDSPNRVFDISQPSNDAMSGFANPLR